MNIIILAAGSGTRFQSDTPKCLSVIGTETVLSRQIRQIREFFKDVNIFIVTGFKNSDIQNYAMNFDTKVQVAYNNLYIKDNNIYSALCGIKACGGDTLVLESDCIFSDDALKTLSESMDEKEALVLLWKKAGKNKDNYVAKFNTEDNSLETFKAGKKDKDINKYNNMIGAVYIPQTYCDLYIEKLKEQSEASLEQYYFYPLIKSKDFNTKCKVISGECYMFSTEEEYSEIVNKMTLKK